MKAKTAFESGNSPPKVSESDAPIQTGRGLEETKRRIVKAFESIRQHPAGQNPVEPLTPQTQIDSVYTEQHKERFRERAKKLTLAALSSPYIARTTDNRVIEITVPTESAEELIAEALRRFK